MNTTNESSVELNREYITDLKLTMTRNHKKTI